MNCKNCSLFILRLLIAVIFFYHGIGKALNPSGAMQFFSSIGLPGFVGAIVGWIEVIGAVLLFLGLFTKWANYALMIVILGALVLVQIKGAVAAVKLTPDLERDLLIFAGTLVISAFGAGKWALQKTE